MCVVVCVCVCVCVRDFILTPKIASSFSPVEPSTLKVMFTLSNECAKYSLGEKSLIPDYLAHLRGPDLAASTFAEAQP